MKLNLKIVTRSIKFQIFIGLTVMLFFLKLIKGGDKSFFITILNETIVIFAAGFLIMYLLEFIHSKKINPLSMVMNVGILNAIIFFIITFSDSNINFLYKDITTKIGQPDLFFILISFIYAFIVIAAVSYTFMTFKELYFLRQKKNVSTYFNTMIVFFLLASFSTILDKYPSLEYVKTTFVVVSIILIVINSLRISWIAFLLKKEKISLLVLSVVIAVLFSVNAANSSEPHIHSQMLGFFSSSLNQFTTLMMIYGIIYFSILFFTTLFHLPTAEAYDRKAQEVSSLQFFSRLINQVMDFNELAETVTDITLKVCNADASWIIWNESNESKTIANKNVGFVDAGIITEFIKSRYKTNKEEQTVLISLNKFSQREQLADKFSSIAVAPLKTHNLIKGYLVAAKRNDFIFDDDDKEAIATFSDYASVAIENSRLLEESIEKERLEKELDLAREIQRKILPEKNPKIDRLSISSLFIPAFEVGGDYYDFFELENNRIGFIIADVSGKGMSAAFIMAELKGIFESLSKTINKPREILIKANEILKRTLDRRNFVSAAYGIIDLEKETLELSRAGHCPIIHIRDKQIKSLRPSGIGLGLNFTNYFNESLEEIKFDLKENDLIVLYTDGITEAKNQVLEDFGSNTFEKILLENVDQDVEMISNKVIKEVTLFSQNISQHDDITLVILKWKHKLNINGEKEWQISAPQFQTKVM